MDTKLQEHQTDNLYISHNLKVLVKMERFLVNKSFVLTFDHERPLILCMDLNYRRDVAL